MGGGGSSLGSAGVESRSGSDFTFSIRRRAEQKQRERGTKGGPQLNRSTDRLSPPNIPFANVSPDGTIANSEADRQPLGGLIDLKNLVDRTEVNKKLLRQDPRRAARQIVIC